MGTATGEQLILNISDIKASATKKLPKPARDYFNDGANDMITLHDNEAAFNRYKLRPRILRGISSIDTSTTVWGCDVSLPLGISPVALQRLAHPDGEIATAKACAAANIAMGLSSWSNTSVEEVLSQSGGKVPCAMQISLLKYSELTSAIIRRAEHAGCKAIILSADAMLPGRRWNDTRNHFKMPDHLELPHLALPGNRLDFQSSINETNISWTEAFSSIRQQTKLPLWVKGVYTPEDVSLAIDHGADGVIISNHGGRQLDGVPASLDALRECSPVARGRISVGFDGGIRRGTDIFKALALGADFCFSGRIAVWGLGDKHDGQQGVELAIKILKDEFELCMVLVGCKNIKEISPSHLSLLSNTGLLSKL